MEEEPREQEILLQPELINVMAGGAVESVNGQTGDVVLTTSDLENTSDYQTGSEVESAISTAVGAEQEAREQADTALQGQIDAISASSDVKDIVGTHAELENYDTSTLGNNDIIKVLQDETEDGATTYYRWNASTSSFSLIGEEGPYYTKSQTDTLLNAKQNELTAGSNITISGSTISATDTTYTAGTGLDLTGTEFSVDNTVAMKTDIPTVNNATLKIQKNSTDVATFTANSSTDVTANISVPTDTNDLTNGAGFQTASDVQTAIAGKQDTLTAGSNIQISGSTISATNTTYTAGNGLNLNGTTFSADTTVLATQTDLSSKQDTLVSGTSIKTINNTSLLGSGDITIPVITVDSALSSTSTNPVQNSVIYAAIGDVESILQTLNSGSGV